MAHAPTRVFCRALCSFLAYTRIRTHRWFRLIQTDAAAQLGVTRAALSRVVNERAAISPEMALRIEQWLEVENGGRADVWLAEQASFDLWQTRQHFKLKVAPAVLQN